ncbi:lysophospholipid acyltransferase family protein [Phycisphaera mikurensis]|uniref:Putative acyltransferase n=1 Tax=Phycisphaera mikurensis (strain NBRC 102666 / KCTC 22515 / FYK2301M01) TaxID=1142394 RepID=I0ICE5_PHYMF|nr:lysophospholipid acyltransferase family protein [Phycisphaera mikurensis]MBB6442190.1 1-acyl-sn-glycerol-3-phosphate acyltransferase [Phycisphaera mikurensis]BAM02933.1 putative acyltransferase [Phycisphaera mikurensis NBRC 102666]
MPRDPATPQPPRPARTGGLLQRVRNRQPGEPVHRILWWQLYHALAWLWFVACYRWRAWGVRNIPDAGPVVFVSNHQSFLDPIVVGLGCHKRQFHPLARKTLWASRFYRVLTVPMNPIPVDQEAGDIKAMKACIEKLNQGHALLLFPEGARTPDGAVKGFQNGIKLILKRSDATVVPVGIAGVFEAWPIHAKLPAPTGRIGVAYGEPIPPKRLRELGPDAGLALVHERVVALHAAVHRRLGGGPR